MAGIPQNFQAISNVLANYNFVDIASGTGYIIFYAGNTVDLKLLSNNTYYSDTILESGDTGNVAYTTIHDHDFDVLLNRPLDISGLGVVNIPVCIVNGYGTNATIRATVTLRKWNGAETDIISNVSRELVVNNATTYTMLAVDLNAPLTHFKKGETLRLNILIEGKVSTGTSSFKYAHDPMNRVTGWDSTGAVPSKLSFQCPVRLNL